VRDAVDGADFVAEVRERAGIEINVLTGDDEARYAALGVVAASPDASGLVGDLGGGSLELVGVDGGEPGRGASQPLGPLPVQPDCGDSLDAARAHIRRVLAEADWLSEFRGKPLYAVGGAWRAVARVCMGLKDYPLSVLHAFRLSASEARDDCDVIARQSPRSLEQIEGVPKKRVETMPYAAVLMREVMAASGASAVVISAGGVREGVLFDTLTAAEKAEDPLLVTSAWLGARFAPRAGAAEAMTRGLFPGETPAENRLRRAACHLADVGAYIHPDHRAKHAFETALRASLSGLDHQERIFLALTLFRRYAGRRADPPDAEVAKMATRETADRALKLGLALRFAAAFAPKAPTALEGAALHLNDGVLTFEAPEHLRALVTENVDRKLAALREACAAEAEEVTFI